MRATVHQPAGSCDEWLRLFATRDEVADVYADLLIEHSANWMWWSEINTAIRQRWSDHALRYIKTRAWKLAESRAKEREDTQATREKG